MAFSREAPHSFKAALALAGRLLSGSERLLSRNLVGTEAEQIVIAAYRRASGKSLSRVDLFARSEDRFPEEAGRQVIIMAMARAEGKPLQHLTGYQAFLGHEYDVGPDVLVPRPETEGLVMEAARALREAFQRGPGLGLEIGVGCGAISVELLSLFPSLRMIASELTEAARTRAARNAEKILGKESARLRILAAPEPLSVWEPFAEAGVRRSAQLLISNPPYLAKGDPIDDEVLAHEPASALFGPEEDPLHFYRRIAERARAFVAPDGLIFLEIPPERASRIWALFDRFGLSPNVIKDLNGRDRVLGAKVSP